MAQSGNESQSKNWEAVFFMPLCGATFNENVGFPLRRGVGGCLSCSLHGAPRLGHPPGPNGPGVDVRF
jgi:hypothetical protein